MEARMSIVRRAAGCAFLAAVAANCLSGCSPARTRSIATGPPPVYGTGTSGSGQTASLEPVSRGRQKAALATVGFEASSGTGALPHDGLFGDQSELTVESLIDEVQARNPTLQAALAAWGAAAERYPQAVALDDPMLQTMLAPGSFSSSSGVPSSYFVGVAQKLPWSGKRELRGNIAAWEAYAASLDYKEAQQRLEETARVAFFEYYLVDRQIALTAANETAVQEFRETVRSRLEANQAPEQDLLQADLELAKLEQRQIELQQMRQEAAARINTLLHRHPEHWLPPPPSELLLDDRPLDRDALLQAAVENRPDLSALAARLQAEQNAVALACREYYPDFEFMGRYDAFWFDVEQRGQIGMNVNIPLQQSRRRAAVREAMFRANKLQAEYDQQIDSIHNEVSVALAGVDRGRKTIRLYSEKTLPAAEANVSAARAAYVAGTTGFLNLVAAQRELIDLHEKYQEAVVEYFRQRTALARATGYSVSNHE
jgi:outer membrane protein, heavy metal efflux system